MLRLSILNNLHRVITCLEMSRNLTAVVDFTKNQGNAREKILSWKSCLKLFIVNCIFVSIQVFCTSTGMILVTLNMPSAANCQGISRCLTTVSGNVWEIWWHPVSVEKCIFWLYNVNVLNVVLVLRPVRHLLAVPTAVKHRVVITTAWLTATKTERVLTSTTCDWTITFHGTIDLIRQSPGCEEQCHFVPGHLDCCSLIVNNIVR